MKRDEIISIYCYVVHHLTDAERKKVEQHEKDALYLSLNKVNVSRLEDATLRIVNASLMT